jgi:hypothetical protein
MSTDFNITSVTDLVAKTFLIIFLKETDSFIQNKQKHRNVTPLSWSINAQTNV